MLTFAVVNNTVKIRWADRKISKREIKRLCSSAGAERKYRALANLGHDYALVSDKHAEMNVIWSDRVEEDRNMGQKRAYLRCVDSYKY